MKLLLSGVFGPFGVNDKFGRKENIMELFHNQVTREQGIFSYRFNHNSFGLYFLAENVQMPTTVLDFPSLEDFKKELGKEYDYVGISFIVPNLAKAQEMARLAREISPKTKIILGGHGTNVPEIESKITHDYICRGEGVMFLRSLFKEQLDRPIRHPLIAGSYNKQVMGVPLPDESGIIVSGVGCANKCRFCATSHFFNQYTAYLKTGQDIFDVCCRYEDEMGITDFGIMDENFLKDSVRAKELVDLMEKHKRYFSFAIFSSVETLNSFENLDYLVRLGVNFIWMGVESKQEIYEKNKGANFKLTVRELRKRGISVMTSLILFLEQHTKETIWDDIDFVSGLESDYVQFMQLGPIPGTTLYNNYAEEKKLLTDIPYIEQHGQDMIWFKHPSFTREDSRDYLKKAFQHEYAVNGASLLRTIKTSFMGFLYASKNPNPHIRARALSFKKLLENARPLLSSALLFSTNEKTTELALNLKKEYLNHFGPSKLKNKVLTPLVLLFGIKEHLRIRYLSDRRQPPTKRREFRQSPVKKRQIDLKLVETPR